MKSWISDRGEAVQCGINRCIFISLLTNKLCSVIDDMGFLKLTGKITAIGKQILKEGRNE